MNTERLSVGLQGVGVAERAYQEALAYARERRQGRRPGARDGALVRIVEHPDVRAMLLRMRSLVAASRALCYACAHAIDMSRHGPEPERAAWSDRAGLLTPIAKAFATDAGIEAASLGVQVHGGAGYIEETGAAQHLRDARIFAIYEGTNGIQAIDLVTRKLRLGDGDAVQRMIKELADIARATEASNRPELGSAGRRLADAARDLAEASAWLLAALGEGRVTQALAGATAFLRLFALTAGGCLLARAALEDGETGWMALARYFAETIVPETAALRVAVTEGSGGLEEAAAALLAESAGDRP
jgi:acyl-CoA dehydrogenase